jgi:hypothetical protein
LNFTVGCRVEEHADFADAAMTTLPSGLSRFTRFPVVALALVLTLGSPFWPGTVAAAMLRYRTAPPDNPLKGFVHPGRGAFDDFPHSLEFGYLPLRALMTGPTNFDWTRLEKLLDGAAARGNQVIFRVFLDFPGSGLPTAIPEFLLEDGLATHLYPNNHDFCPDYEDTRLRSALRNFIAALGERYDGDPRIGFIEAGLLGSWGEWRTFSPAWRWFASETVQREVLDAYEAAFHQTKVLVRFPDKLNASRLFGYHDDWFARSTMTSFLEKLESAGPGAVNKWRMAPIGGRIHPLVQNCLWDEPSCAPEGQDIESCVQATHASWLADNGVFRRDFSRAGRERALALATRLGYEFHVSEVEIETASTAGTLRLRLSIENRGVAPFYYDWPMQISIADDEGRPVNVWETDWKLTSVMPGEPATVLEAALSQPEVDAGEYELLLRATNPLPGGKPLRFANAEQDRDKAGWLTLGTLTVGK